MFRRFGVVAVTLLAILFFANIVCQAQPQPFLTRHVPAVVANGKAQLVGHLPADQVMRFDIVMPLRDRLAWTSSYSNSTILLASFSISSSRRRSYRTVWSQPARLGSHG